MTIKLIATDMDGTLLCDDRTFDYARMEDLLDELDEGYSFCSRQW